MLPKFLSEIGVGADDGAIGGNSVSTPMPGVLDKILVKVGDQVKAGDSVAVIIAMKMEHVLKAPRDGRVKLVGAVAGSNIAKGVKVVVLEEESEQ